MHENKEKDKMDTMMSVEQMMEHGEIPNRSYAQQKQYKKIMNTNQDKNKGESYER